MARNKKRRKALVDAAVVVLAAQGARGLTYRAIDAEANVPKGTTSNYFSSRERIIEAVLLRIGERLQPDPAVHEELAFREPNVELFADYLCDIVKRLTSNRDVALALFELRIEATRNQAVADVLSTWRRAGLAADIEFTACMGLPATAKEVQLFHYVLDGLILDQITVPMDDEVYVEKIVCELVHRILGE